MFNFEEEIKKLPDKPGVYLMHDANDNIIYIGKARVLKNRVRQYFQSDKNKTPKIKRMVSLIAWFEYIVVDSEVEALALECNLIKEHRPKYNTMLMDDKAYPYIKITTKEDFPRVLYSHRKTNDNAKYFGPYMMGSVKDVLNLLRKIYPYRSCNRNINASNTRTCLYYDLGQCIGPCADISKKEEYSRNIDGIIDFLNGKVETVTKKLEESMLQASEELEFEKAAYFRDLLTDVKRISQKQKMNNNDNGNQDIIGLANLDKDAVIQVFYIRNGKMIGREHFHVQHEREESRESVMTDFIKQYYAQIPSIPKELVVGEEIEDLELIEEWLSSKRGSKVYIRLPQKGKKEKLVILAQKNASLVLQQDLDKLKKKEQRTKGAQDNLAQILNLSKLSRIEAYDISNTAGFESVGSMIVFEDGKAKKNAYRKFKIKTVDGPNDYASLKEVLTRRLTHGIEERKQLEEKGQDVKLGSFTCFPDLILMDGGKGQVNIAKEVFSTLGIEIPVCGMVKDDNHRTRGLYFNDVELPIDLSSEVFKLITRIQDETHRFAIEYHKSLRSKKQVHSFLDDIEGIGATRRRDLLKHFKSKEALGKASMEELLLVPSMNKLAAQAILDYFSSIKEKDRENQDK